MLLMEGPEVAKLYVDPAVRNFRDVDLIVPNAPDTQRRLLSAGFVETGDPKLFENIHHLRPLLWPGLPLLLEVHHRPKWSIRCATGGRRVDGGRGAEPLGRGRRAHTLAGAPRRHGGGARLGSSAALAATGPDRRGPARGRGRNARARKVAGSWAFKRYGPPPRVPSTRFSARGGDPRRSRSGHDIFPPRASRPFSSRTFRTRCRRCGGCPARIAIAAAAGAVGADLRPEEGEGWPAKLTRSRAALANAFVRKSKHDEALDAARGGS